MIVSVLISLKATSPRDSLAVITPGVEEHLTVAVEGEIHPVENIILSISSFDLTWSAPACPGWSSWLPWTLAHWRLRCPCTPHCTCCCCFLKMYSNNFYLYLILNVSQSQSSIVLFILTVLLSEIYCLFHRYTSGSAPNKWRAHLFISTEQ